MKREAVAQIGREPRKKLREIDVCDQLEELCIGMRLSSVSKVDLPAVEPVSVELITAELNDLALCQCHEYSCMPCTLRNLGEMVGNVLICELQPICEQFSDKKSSLPAEHVHCSSLKTLPGITGDDLQPSPVEHSLTSVDTQAQPLPSAAVLDEPSCSAQPVPPLPAMSAPATSGCFGLNLGYGSHYALLSEWTVGRFKISTYALSQVKTSLGGTMDLPKAPTGIKVNAFSKLLSSN